MRASLKKKLKIANNPVIVTFLSFLLVIFAGFILLSLPISSIYNQSVPLFKSFFVSTSATCITCLTMNDTISQWSMFGKTVILILIQIGGLGLISFSSFFSLSINKKLSLKNMKLANSQVNIDDFSDIQKLFKNILITSFAVELIGAVFLSFPYCRKFGSYGLFMAIFTSISAYCNAGFDLKSFLCPNSSFEPIKDSPTAMAVSCVLTIIGGIGFIIINEFIKFKKTKPKLKFLSTHSKIALSTSIVLIVLGAAVILYLEFNNTLKNMNLFEKISVSTFNSIAARSSGFAIVDFLSMSNLTKYFISFLMFIGACPSGTGGGIKTTTFIILMATTFCAMKNSDEVSIFYKKINKTTIYKSISLFFISVFFVLTSTFLIYNFDRNVGLTNIFFTATSTFSTTGIQLVDTAIFSSCSKIVLIVLMFIGRVGPLMFAALFFCFFPLNSKKQFAMPIAKIYIC